MANIHDLARLSGVSPSTVSRVFNGYTDVSEATRVRVLEVARELDYTPSAAARSLVRRRSQLVGVILHTGPDHPDLQHPFFQDVLVALKNAVGRAGYDLLVFATEGAASDAGPHSYAKRVRHHGVDGVVLMGVDPSDREVEKVGHLGIPVMGIDLATEGQRAGYVMSDNLAGARLAVRHLHALGHTRIATIAGPQDTVPGADRLRGYERELAALGLPYSAQHVLDGDFYTDSGRAAMRVLLALAEPPTAVFAASDLMAVGALQAVQEAGLRVPEDIAVVGFDDVQIAPLVSPALTTIRQDKAAIGQAAAAALVTMIEDPEAVPPVVTVPVELVVRASSAAPSPAAGG
jgi:LacI family transcriptional regulator